MGAALAALTAATVACSAHAAQETASPSVLQADAPSTDSNILVVGMDSGRGRVGTPYADTLMLVHVPKSGDAVDVLSIPRDTYLRGAVGIGMTKVDAVYGKALAVERHKAPGAGEQELAQKAEADLVRTVQDLTGVTINHYAQVDMAGFAELSTAVGGVRVCLKHAAHDPYSGADLPAGAQTIQGDTALAFVRQRHGLPNGDLGRVVRQQVFVAGLVEAATRPGVLTDGGARDRLIAAVRKHVVLDQGWDLLSFASRVRDLSRAGVATATIPIKSDQVVDGVGDALIVDVTAVRSYTQDFFAQPRTDSGSHTQARPPVQAGSGGTRCVN